MRFTEQTRYALQVLTYCSERHPELVQVAAIAADKGMTEHTIYKLLKIATKGGVVTSTRGRGGGIRLSRPPSEITVGSVMRLFEPRFQECTPAAIMTDPPRGEADKRLDAALGLGIRTVLDTYDRLTLADLAASPAPAEAGLKGSDRPPTDRPDP